VPKERQYALRSNGPFAFVNYRRDATMIMRHNEPPRLERGSEYVAASDEGITDP
jgi:hypothetical protein